LRVAVFDRDAARVEALADDLGERAIAVVGDVNDDEAVAAAIGAASSLGVLSVLVNVAGGGVGGGPTVRDDGTPHEMASFRTTMAMNAFGTFNVTRLVAAAMAENEPDGEGQRGVVVHTASIAGMEGQRGQVAYAATKAAILGMTLPMARDLAPLGFRVCAIAPGTVATPVMVRLVDRLDEDPTKGLVFPPRMGRPEEFALLVDSIVANPYLNGEIIRLDGALRLAGT
jgi:NAD(P)-dependent dehydrogenase (short-subunit alcohol dehydrogenase family)